MQYTTIAANLIFFAAVPALLNVLSMYPLFSQKKGRRFADSPSLLPLLLLLLNDVALSMLLLIPLYSLITEEKVFPDDSPWMCAMYGSADMSLSLNEIALATLIAFDRYIVTKQPKWGTWRSNCNYTKLITVIMSVCVLWSFVPWTGYGRYATFDGGSFCSLDWRQAEPNIVPAVPTVISEDGTTRTPSMDEMKKIAEEWKESTHRYIAFLTATFLIFFLIPVCISGAFYYSVIEHVEKLNSAEAREQGETDPREVCSWSPSNHIAKVGLGCLLVSSLPFMAYAVVCLNPFKSNFEKLHVVATPVIIARLSSLLNPLFYVWLNPEIVAIEEKLLKKLQKPKKPVSQKGYQTINFIAEVPGMSFPILTPTVPRRQLPQIPPHLISPKQSITVASHWTVPSDDRKYLSASHV